METRRSSKRKEREEAPPSGTQQTSRKTQRISKPSSAAEAHESAASGNADQTALSREAERANSPSGGPATRLRAKRAAAAAAAQPPVTTTGRTGRTRAKARAPSAEPEERQLPKEASEAALPQAAAPSAPPPPPPVPAPALAVEPAAEAEKQNQGSRRLTPSQLREMANRQGRGQGMDDDKDLAEVFGRNFSGAGSALQGLLRKLGAGFDDIMPMGGVSGSRMKAIMQGLRQMEDEAAQLSALSELNELLSISTEDNLSAFPIESMVPLLIQLLNAEHNPDIMLMAARALTFLADVLPQSCGAIVRHGAVPAFCARLLTIEYIDLAEQSLQALEKLSHEHAPSLLQNGSLLAVLSYLDFFPTGVQRTATATAANICRSLAVSPTAASSSAAQSAVKEAIPILTGLLHYSDAKVVDNACVSLSYIAEASAGQTTLLEALTSGSLVGQALQLIAVSETGAMTSQLSLSTYYGLLKLLATAAASSASVATALLGAGALATARTLLATSPLLMGAGSGGAVLLRTPDQLHEVLGLLAELLPLVPDSQTLMASDTSVELPQAGAAAAAAGSGSKGAAAASNGGRQGAAARGVELLAYLATKESLAKQLCNEILPLVLSSYSATVISEVRARALRVLLQILVACPAEQLREALRDLPLAAFLASLLTARDTATLAAALHCCEVLMAKLPDVFKHVFLKEGVAHAIGQVASLASATAATAGAGTGSPPSNAARGSATAPAAPTEEPRRVTRSSLLSAREDKAQALAAVAAAANAAVQAAAAASAAATAAAPAAAPSSRMPPSSPGGASLRSALAARAARFKKAHYDMGCGAPETEGLVRVRSLLQRLPSEPSATLTELLVVMATSTSTTSSGLSAALAASGGPGSAPSVSVFELLNSGAVKMLLDFFTGADLPVATTSEAVEERTTAILRRIAALTRAGLTPTDGSLCNPPLIGLVRKLQAALSSAETFPVHYGRAVPPSGSGSFRSGGGYGGRGGNAGSASALNPGSLSSGLSLLTHPFKLRLCRHGSDSTLRDYSSNIVLIEPLATMTAIEEFLWPRVYRGSPAAAVQRQQQEGAAAPATTSGGGGAATAAAPAAPPAAAAEGSGSGAGSGAAATTPAARCGGAAAARSVPIPVDESGASNRRVTRSQAARERAEAEEAARRRNAVPVPTRGGNRRNGGASAGDGKDGGAGGTSGATAAAAAAGGEAGGRGHQMADMGNDAEKDEEGRGGAGRRRSRGRVARDGGGSEPDEDDMEESPDGDGDAEMDDARAAGDAMFDEDDEDFDDDGMDGDEGDGDIGHLHVHDLHVDQPSAAGAAGNQPQAAGAAAQQAVTSAGAAAAVAAASGRPASAWGSRPSAAAAAATAAAAAGVGSGPNGGAGGRSDAHEAAAARLVFCAGSDERPALSAGSTVFQAIQQLNNQQQPSGEAEEDGEEEQGQRRGRRLWEEIHTLYYRPAGPDDAKAEAASARGTSSGSAAGAGGGGHVATAAGADNASASGPGGSTGLGRWGSTPLRELLAPRVPADLSGTQACREVLALLALLEAVNRLGPRACAELDAVGAGGPEEDSAGPLESTRHVPRDEFVSTKLSSKLAQQLKDVLSICGGGMPSWCAALAAPCRFLFPFEIRKRYFYSTAFGLGRALQHMQQLHTAEAGGAPGGGHVGGDRDGRELRVGRLQRQKVRVSRKRILESAAKVMELYARSRAVLELEYFGEVGTGLGPTLEFYTLLSHELQRKDLSMWRHEEQDDVQEEQAGGQDAQTMKEGEAAVQRGGASVPPSPDKAYVDGGAGAAAAVGPPASQRLAPTATTGVSVPSRRGEAATHEECEYVNAPWGLFPRPLSPAARGTSAGLKVVEHFRLLGRTLAKALQDNRLLDLPLSHVFYAAALGSPLDLWDIARFDPGLGGTLAKLHSALAAYRAAGGSGPLLVDGVATEDLCIAFVLPGQPDYPLRPGGADLVVSSAEQLGEYIDAVVDATLGSGVAAQVAAFREGFNEVFSLSTLSLFHEDEVEVLLCGSGERWTLQVLSEAIKFDHGYTANSQPVKFLLEILSELDAADQRAFLRFVTGCPRLPPGGLTALHPRLTVVRKHPSGGDGPSNGPTPVGSFQETSLGLGLGAASVCAADADLPSVMTCANYIKLPPYSSKAVMATRLMYAIREGQGSFDLS